VETLLNQRIVSVLTTGRQDYSILRGILLLLKQDSQFDLRLFAGGMHLSEKYGRTAQGIEEDGFQCHERFDWLVGESEPSIARQTSGAVQQVADALARHNPEFLLLVGDRYETAGAALAAAVSCVPIVHLHGGEETEGAVDNVLRHAITKMSHLHLVSHPDYAARVIQMGEDPASVHVVGAPGLDNLFRSDLASRVELERKLGIKLDAPMVVVNVHPTTLGDRSSAEVEAVIAAMERTEARYVISLPNSDPGNELIRSRLKEFAAGRAGVVVTEALGDRFFPAVLRAADAIIGNSSSGIIEAPALGVPTVNVGDRQKGRRLGPSIISVPPDADAVSRALAYSMTPEFRRTAHAGMQAPVDFRPSERVVSILQTWKAPRPQRKRFFGLPQECLQS
jgi:UDP-hydrolysing UDP-N-acetyl-D-glucosamine 2-epimerase